MVGLSHVVLRLLIKEYLPSGATTFWPTEMLNSRRVPSERLDLTPETRRSPSENHLVPQILGNEPEPIRLSVERLIEWGAVGVDINMGCPVRKALQHNYGVALMGDAAYAAAVVKMASAGSLCPVGVKLRAGLQNDLSYLLGFIDGLVASGARWVTLHPRTAEMKRRGRADWSQIASVVSRFDIPVIGNGDVQVAADVTEMIRETGCSGVMVGRALTARPWMVWQVGEDLGWKAPEGREGERAPRSPVEEGQECGRALLRYIELMGQAYGDLTESLRLRKARFHIKTMAPWLAFGHELFSRSTRVDSLSELQEMVGSFFNQPQEMIPRTELRQ
jgi:tRNA-dihydrouridine synthase